MIDMLAFAVVAVGMAGGAAMMLFIWGWAAEAVENPSRR
jgi:hypothetical protein